MTSPEIDAAERAVFAALAGVEYEKRAVRLPTGDVLNTLSAGSRNAPTLVVVHGWGAGVGFFARNMPGLSAQYRVHMVDWLGFGGSSRPQFSTTQSPENAERFFVDALEMWADAMTKLEGDGFAPFHLVGHSLGAFLATGFTLRRPQTVRSVVLASPVGVPRRPQGVAGVAARSAASFLQRLVRWIVLFLWECGVTPQWVMRLLGPRLGRALSGKLVRPRFPSSCPDTQEALVEYFYQVSAAPPSGEHSLNTILRSGAWARLPLVDKLPHVVRPVTFIYGDRDWMDWSAARDLLPRMKREARLLFVKNAGHHMYYDQPDMFNSFVLESCCDVDAGEE